MYKEVEAVLVDDAKLANITRAVYFLQAASLFLFFFPLLIGVVINYIKRDDVRGTLYESHFKWQIRTFWTVIGGFLLGAVTVLILVGVLVLGVLLVWYIYRFAKGFLYLYDGKPMPY